MKQKQNKQPPSVRRQTAIFHVLLNVLMTKKYLSNLCNILQHYVPQDDLRVFCKLA